MNMQQAVAKIIAGEDLSGPEMTDVMALIMTGEATQAQIGGFLVGLRIKGETVTEITAAAKVMRQLATPVKVSGAHLVDTCGTGGDGTHTFNISTAAALVTAAAGGQVAKHGNRSVSSSSGSADVLEALGVRIDLDAGQVSACIEQVGIGFLFAPAHHGAMKHAIGPRRELGTRTIFNLLGPLTNPAGAPCQLIGVYDQGLVEPIAQVLKLLGSERVLVVCGEDGLDEFTITGATHVAELKAGEVTEYSLTPDQLGLSLGSLEPLMVASAAESAKMIKQIFAGESGPARDIVLANAGAAIYVAGLVDSLLVGVNLAAEVIDAGQAAEKLAALVELTQRLGVH
ncbi:MAG: anthranilate phosphoribosyltransferase [Immundisolibacteraceae bacterium]|nr:anthranilate phosphoribosyltransferase [Immundisolibacteraceae bacterium]